MKSLIFCTLLVLSVGLSQSCSRSSNNDDQLQMTSQAQVQSVTNGTWRVTLFTDSGKDETGDFAGYSFQFNSNGNVTAAKSNTAKNGTWRISSGSNKFNIDLGAKTASNKPLGELTDDWRVISITTSEIKLSDDNTSSSEFLTFTKN